VRGLGARNARVTRLVAPSRIASSSSTVWYADCGLVQAQHQQRWAFRPNSAVPGGPGRQLGNYHFCASHHGSSIQEGRSTVKPQEKENRGWLPLLRGVVPLRRAATLTPEMGKQDDPPIFLHPTFLCDDITCNTICKKIQLQSTELTMNQWAWHSMIVVSDLGQTANKRCRPWRLICQNRWDAASHQ
jgi:hypothetical protein